MNDLTIVDTDILIDAALRVQTAIGTLDQIESESALAISVVTQMELIVGCRNKIELRNTDRFLQRFQILRLKEETCNKAVELLHQYRLSHGLLIPDSMIAATAITLECPLITKNQRDFHLYQ